MSRKFLRDAGHPGVWVRPEKSGKSAHARLRLARTHARIAERDETALFLSGIGISAGKSGELSTDFGNIIRLTKTI